MDLLRSHLSKVRIPEPSNRIYKQECCISFETPRSEGGLFVDLCSFLAFGKDYVMWQYEKTGNPVYLNIKETLRPHNEDRPHKKPTILAIGVEGGFNTREDEYDVSYSIVILPDFVQLPYPDVNLPEKVRLAVEGVLAAIGAEHKEEVKAWTADKKRVSAFAYNLKQLEHALTVPPSGWKCVKCDKTDNLWLNLTDGLIFCGRRNWDGSGGNNHAVEHYDETKYPLAVKLGTITMDLETADVYSYPEDETVEDPFLAQHLAHFGIDFSSLKKTELTTAERELNQNANFDWNRIQESGKDLEPLFGPGYTGLVNIGNSCYLASIIQVIFSTRDFQLRYYENLSLYDTFQQAPAHPTIDLSMQLVKLAYGLLSGKYSLPVDKVSGSEIVGGGRSEKVQNGISPRMLKSLIGAGHPEFGSSRQQDALEFFQHFLDHVERSNASNCDSDPSQCFKFYVEERILCSSSRKVKYTKRIDNILSLNIPLDAAMNKDEVALFLRKKAERESDGEKLKDDEIVRPRVALSACLESFAASEEVPDFYSSAINARTTAIKSTRLATFPDYLVLHMRKFVLDAGWIPRKLDVFLDIPDTIDINHLRGKGLQPDEGILPETDSTSENIPAIDESVVAQLMEMGFPRERCKKAVVKTSNSGLELAMQWLISHMDDPDIDTPLDGGSGKSSAVVDQCSLDTLASFGFERDVASRALKETEGDVERAAEWIFSHPEESSGTKENVSSSPGAMSTVLPDGHGNYKLIAFVSHMGTSTQSGHYVAHIVKEGKWVICNDCKVAVSGDPPKEMGYLYFFQRINT